MDIHSTNNNNSENIEPSIKMLNNNNNTDSDVNIITDDNDNNANNNNNNKSLVVRVRQNFFDTHYLNEPDSYDSTDMDSLREANDYIIRRFLAVNDSDTDRTVSHLAETYRWRKSFPVRRDFSQCGVEVFQCGAMFIHGVDREGRPVLYARVKTHVKIAELERLAQDIVVTTLEKLAQLGNDKGFTVVMDVSGAGLSNVDLKMVKFMVQALHYYPEALQCILVVNVPTLIKPFMPIVRLILGSKYSHMLHIVNDRQLFDHIEPSQVPKYLGGDSNYDFTQPPTECTKTCEQLSHLFDLDPKVVRKSIRKFEPHMRDARQLVLRTIDVNSINK
ncbi:motile sperm domain-containing protein 2-like [Oppia nitens]|uniref:motile sperm domain-containing protein 2-like n=1 Tax=Oppia nitens TaxID=1686743 RepID=UPI0023DC66CD|nr:motile sperm domain-containing protein 2-like [Oppia nitens]